MFRLFLALFAIIIACDALEQPCPVFVSVDITDGIRRNQAIIKDNITYTPENYFSFEGRIRGCICNIKPCIRKCCPRGQIMNNGRCEKDDYEQDFPIHTATDRITLSEEHFYYIHNNHCSSNQSYILDPSYEEDLHYLQANGSLFWPSAEQMFQIHEYCIETFNDDNMFNYTDTVLICFEGAKESSEAFYIGKEIICILY